MRGAPVSALPSGRLMITPRAAIALGWALLVITGISARTLIPLDETRYVGVAWEMWQRGDFLVPYLNGAPYSHKPPLLFWLIHAGWGVFGVNAWWPRLVAPLFALASLYLTVALSRRLWSNRPDREHWLAGVVLLGTISWTGYQTLTMFDTLMVFFTLAALLALLAAARGERRGWILFGVALGMGILAKGPVILVYSLPAALTAPLWSPVRRAWWRWYAALVLAVLFAAAIALAWALPAAQAGGASYGEALLWRQSAGRIVHSFAHRRAWWWYLAIAPAMLFPWLWWPTLWRATLNLIRGPTERGLRLVLIWGLTGVAALSAISAKQPQYLLPLLPAFALYTAHALAPLAGPEERLARAPIALLVGGLAVAWIVAPRLLAAPSSAWWLERLNPGWGIAIGALALAWWLLARQATNRLVPWLAGLSVALALLVNGGLVRIAAPAYDPRQIATRIARLQASGAPIANVGKYHDQFQFYGRLTRPLEVVSAADARAWARRHPDGWLVSYPRRAPAATVYAQRFRGRYVTLIGAIRYR